ncbi:uncharacterized protein LOC131609705 isoform X2 [Vicia villosa]|uniref:uncharacterized protein LOC131609705 isoform X2 n=1 Tax=Vicia villosa TaxID=3911 RepID=UPI00273C3B1A|nr:uncharacterized protein LOC131609705 isoform X2 [Vicia villosa]
MNPTAALSYSLAASSLSSAAFHRRSPSKLRPCTPFSFRHRHCLNHSSSLRVVNDSDRTELSSDAKTETYSEADKIVDSMNFGELCNEFECNSSPSIESTARQLALDIFELRSGNRALGTYAVSVTYKDPIRSFTGREKYKRPLWATIALDNPSVTVQEMTMLSTSVLRIKWTIRGKPKSVLAGLGGDLTLKVTSQFTLNQISGQVIEHEELWDLSASSATAQAFFWTSRVLYTTVESIKDLADSAKNLSANFSSKNENMDIYPDPSGDPTKFFQKDDSFQQDIYQIALLLAVIYFVVQVLRITL